MRKTEVLPKTIVFGRTNNEKCGFWSFPVSAAEAAAAAAGNNVLCYWSLQALAPPTLPNQQFIPT